MQNSSAPNTGAPSPGPYAAIWRDITSFIFDIRFLQTIGQLLFVILLVAGVSKVTTDMFAALDAQGLTPDYGFFENRAGFDIGESPDWYSPDASYWSAFQVGLINTLRIVSAGLVGATLLGILFGVFLLSGNWLVRSISRVYVELLRNTPLLIQLFVWYFVAVLSLPVMNDAIALPKEGVSLIPIRLALYVIALVFLLRQYPGGHARRAPYLIGLTTLVLSFELAQTINGDLYGLGELNNGRFQFYAILSLLAIVLVAESPAILRRLRPQNAAQADTEQKDILGVSYNRLRNLLLGLVGGQFVGGLLFYFGIIPGQTIRTEIYPFIFLSNRGFVFPEIQQTGRFSEWLAFVGLGVLAASALWIYFGRINETTGQSIPRERYAMIALLVCAVAGWFLVGFEPLPENVAVEQDGQTILVPLEDALEQELLSDEDSLLYSTSPFVLRRPVRRGLRFAVGVQISPEYISLLLGLMIYTSAFIAEIVRAGIQAVPHGQIEAARALGLTQTQTLRMVILPQALRVIIPPLGNQFLNLAKNSSLAIAIGFADFYQISTTVMNQSGQSVTGMSIVMISYLTISLTISATANWVNRRFQLVTR